MAAAQPDPTQGGSGPPESLHALQRQQSESLSHTRRMRPPTIESFAEDANRVPLRPEKAKRESRMGLRSLFGRSSARNTKDARAEPRLSGGVRSSIADFSNWPHALHASRSEAQLSTMLQSETSSTAGSNKSLPPLPTISVPRRTNTNGKEKAFNTTPPKAPTAAAATWHPPPLFQAYPQAIRHAHLPAPALSADALIRQNARRGSDLHLLEDLNQTTSALETDGQSSKAQNSEKSKKRHRRNTSTSTLKLDWTTKVFVLVTSGYLLQYSGEGQFDRGPEKILQLNKTSAAFASDSIPGRHWVLQVCSSMEPDGTLASDSRSIFSRIPFRGEKKSASNFLMVFEDADDMESWIVLLRREIEALGGKKNLSETGKPKVVEALVSGSLKPQASQRTLIVRDPERFSRVISPDQFSWNNESSASSQHRPDTPPEQNYDDVSTTTSIVSHDGRQLDSLRDSGNRLSYLSSGQRTVITSTGSSPAASPIRESFSSEQEDSTRSHALDVMPEVRLRPNAALISDRRQSMQSLTPMIDYRPIPPPIRPQSTTPDAGSTHSPVSFQTIPNFSVPQSVGKRYSFVRSPSMEGGQFPPPPLHARQPLLKGMRKSPPTALPMTRPLSTVADQPSPDSPHIWSPTQQRTTDIIASEAPDSASMFSSWIHETTWEQSQPATSQARFPARRSSFMPTHDTMSATSQPSPRRFSSMQTLRASSMSPEPTPPEFHGTFHIPNPSTQPRGLPPVSLSEMQDDSSRCRSSMESYGSRSLSPGPPSSKKSNRASMMSMNSLHSNHSQSSDAPSRPLMQRPIEVTVTEFDSQDHSSHLRHISIIENTPRSQQGLVPSAAKNLYNRRSMPQLVEGPPLAPPPNCALPPIPQKHPETSSSHWKTVRI
ncbi:hypothetical protein MKZ38_009874 [Zalerion maritima]|uniref:Peptidase family M20/M25/M40 protein n=1 Tax=Zalerion maritima TaxID=339359 RepID=A0AAD5RT22_9PEZI|nr:hypothetical protein MKZ38_009874 [Zalerion maritima]